MSFRHAENELDNLLFDEVSKIHPDEAAIRDLVKKGANINAINCTDTTVIGSAIEKLNDVDDLKYIKLLIELGADVNLLVNGAKCLIDAVFLYRTALVSKINRPTAM